MCGLKVNALELAVVDPKPVNPENLGLVGDDCSELVGGGIAFPPNDARLGNGFTLLFASSVSEAFLKPTPASSEPSSPSSESLVSCESATRFMVAVW